VTVQNPGTYKGIHRQVSPPRGSLQKSRAPWRERDQRLAEALPVCRVVRRVTSRPATAAVHAAIVALGFEGTVLKRPSSLYRPGRHGVWHEYKARHTAQGVAGGPSGP
jgi:ATP-dependent DNA ligase